MYLVSLIRQVDEDHTAVLKIENISEKCNIHKGRKTFSNLCFAKDTVLIAGDEEEFTALLNLQNPVNWKFAGAFN